MNLMEFTAKDLFDLHDSVFSDRRVISADWIDLVRICLEKMIRRKIGHISPYELRDLYLSLVDAQERLEVPIDIDKFCFYFCEKWLSLVELPRNNFFKFFERAQGDVNEIQNRIKELQSDILSINNASASLSLPDIDYKRRASQHFLEINQTALREIQEFIVNKLSVEAIYESQKKIIPKFFDIPYPYAFLTYSKYDPVSLTDLSNKFQDCTRSEYAHYLTLYKESPNEFLNIIREYVGVEQIAQKIAKCIEKNHLLNSRKEALYAALESFSEGKYLLFIHIAPLQIEGIFHNYSIEIGVNFSKGSISEKLRHLKNKEAYLRHYEYYAFQFPIVRNQIAHGAYSGRSVELDACMLLLDLYDVCNQMVSKQIFINRIVEFYSSIDKEAISLSALEKAALLWGQIVPDFYGFKDLISTIEIKLKTPEFWVFLSSRIDKRSMHESLLLYQFACKFRKSQGEKTQINNFIRKVKEFVGEEVDSTMEIQDFF